MATAFAALWALFAAAIIAALTAWLQQRSWKRQEEVKRNDRAQHDARSVANDLSTLVAKRIYRQKRFAWYKLNNDGTEADAAEYRMILLEWNDRLADINARLMYSFGYSTTLALDREIHQPIALAHRSIQDQKSSTEIVAQLSAISEHGYRFCEALQRRAKNFELEGYEGKKTICYSNRASLSNSHLLMRLLGLSNET